MNEHFENPFSDEIRALLKRVQNIAVVGLSASPLRPSHGVAKALQGFGYRVFPVNPGVESVLGEQAYPTLNTVPERVDLVDVFRAPKHVAGIIEECLALNLPALWLQDGVIDEVAALRAKGAGMQVVMNRCVYRDYTQLVLDRA